METLDTTDLEPKELAFQHKGKWYICREASGAAAHSFRKLFSKHAKLVDGKITADLSEVQDAEIYLLAFCTYRTDQETSTDHYEHPTLPLDSAGNPDMKKLVKMDEIRQWPNRLIKRLFEWVKVNSDLEEKPKAASANGDTADPFPQSMPAGSE